MVLGALLFYLLFLETVGFVFVTFYFLLLLRAQLQADVAATLAKERVVAEQLQSAREQREKAQAAATAAEQAAQVAKDELGGQ